MQMTLRSIYIQKPDVNVAVSFFLNALLRLKNGCLKIWSDAYWFTSPAA